MTSSETCRIFRIYHGIFCDQMHANSCTRVFVQVVLHVPANYVNVFMVGVTNVSGTISESGTWRNKRA